MPFRYSAVSNAKNSIPEDPLARFVELYEAFDDARRFFEDRAPIRFAAATLVTTPGEATQIVERVRGIEADLRHLLGWFTSIAPSLRLILAAVLHKREDNPQHFVGALDEARQRFRKAGLRRSEVYELLAFTILRGQAGGGEVDDTRVERLRQIYLEMRRYHFWLTGPEDLPACAALTGTENSVQAIGEGTEAVFQALRSRAGWWPGEQLHTASHIMFLSGSDPSQITERAAQMCDAFKAAGHKVRGADYDNIALLTFLALPVSRIVESVLAAAKRIQDELHMWFGRAAAFNLAVSIAFVQLLQGDEDLERLSDVKTLLDMQAIIAAQAAAGAAAS